jgi:hypothetical protein
MTAFKLDISQERGSQEALMQHCLSFSRVCAKWVDSLCGYTTAAVTAVKTCFAGQGVLTKLECHDAFMVFNEGHFVLY